MPSEIEWLWMPGYRGEAWNVITGCTKISPGCANCYAERMAIRFKRDGGSYLPGLAEINFHPERMDYPARWREPRMIFMNSVSDIFHDEVSDAQIDAMLAVVFRNPRHIFLALTKRPHRMVDYFGEYAWQQDNTRDRIEDRVRDAGSLAPMVWPLPNLWMGISVENQHFADERIPLLNQVPAVIRWLSVEPLLGPIVWGDLLTSVDWFVIGGESGPKARPMHPNWVGEGITAADAHSIPVFFKQWGEHRPWVDALDEGKNRKVVEVKYKRSRHPYGWKMVKVGKGEAGASLSAAGFLVDKRREWPEYGLRYGM